MNTILESVLKLLNDAMGYLRMFIIGGASFFVAKDFALKMATSDEQQRASYDRKVRNTIIASGCALLTSIFVNWILSYFK